jgi:hypothetical protein
LADDFVFSALVMRGRTKSARRSIFEFNALKIAVEGEIEIEARLFAIGDDIEAGSHLVMDGGDDGVFLKFGAIGFADLVEVRAGEFEPTGERVTADDRGPKRKLFHKRCDKRD